MFLQFTIQNSQFTIIIKAFMRLPDCVRYIDRAVTRQRCKPREKFYVPLGTFYRRKRNPADGELCPGGVIKKALQNFRMRFALAHNAFFADFTASRFKLRFDEADDVR
jgi:hypothetical protein